MQNLSNFIIQNKKRLVFALLIFLIGVILFFTPFNIACVCHPRSDGSFMKCHWMGEAVRMLGGLIAVLGIVFAFSKKKWQMALL